MFSYVSGSNFKNIFKFDNTIDLQSMYKLAQKDVQSIWHMYLKNLYDYIH